MEGRTLIKGILIDSRIEALREDSLASRIGSPYMTKSNLMRDGCFDKTLIDFRICSFKMSLGLTRFDRSLNMQKYRKCRQDQAKKSD